MKKILKTTAGITLLLTFVMLLTGCINIEMKVNKDGSCDLKYEIKTEGMISLSEVKDQLQNGVDEMNKDADKTVAKLKSVKEKDGTITAIISISNISYMEEDAFFGKYSDFDKKYPGELETLVDAKSGKPIDKPALKGTGGLNVVMLPGVDTGGVDLLGFTMILPGSVKYMSSNVTVIDDKTVSLGGGYGVVLYKRGGGGAGWLIIVLIIVAVAAVGFVLLGKNKKGSPSAGYTPAPAAAPGAPVQAGTAAYPGPTAAPPAPAPTAAPAPVSAPTAPAATPVAASSAPSSPSAPAATPAAPTSPSAPTAAPGAGNDAGVVCPHCNSVQKSTAVFCSACGGRIKQ